MKTMTCKQLEAMEKMRKLMNNPKAMKKWTDEKRKEFYALPEDS